MILEPLETKLLEQLGLTPNEAIIFLTLEKLGKTTVKNISGTAKLYRESTYRILNRLIEKGIVEEEIDNPKKYKTVSITHACNFLLDNQKKKLNQIVNQTQIFLNQHKKAIEKKQKEEKTIKIIPKGIIIHKKIDEEIKQAKESINFTIPFGIFSSWQRFFYEDDFKARSDEQIPFNLLIGICSKEKPKINIKTPENICIRYFHCNPIKKPCVGILLFDKKRVFIESIIGNQEIHKSRMYFTDNPSLVELSNNYFESNWKYARPITN